jgi:predicted aspartyl protease
MRRSVLFASRVLLVSCLALSAHAWAESSPASTESPAVPFELVSSFLVVVNGQVAKLGNLRFILDTGSTYSVIDQRVAEKLRLRRSPGKITNFDRDVAVEWAEVRDLRAGPIQASAARVLVVKLTDYSEFAGNVDGIIGLDLLSRGKKLTIDYEKRLVSFDPGEGGTESRLPARTFVVPVVVQGFRMRLLVDTGFHDMLLYRDRLFEGLPNVSTLGEPKEAAIGRMRAKQVSLPGVKIIGRERVSTVFLIDSPENGDPHGVDGYLGPAALHAKRIELDFAALKLRWQ